MPTTEQPPLLETTRRDFLKMLTTISLGMSGVLGLAAFLRFLSYQPDTTPPTLFDLGPATDYAVGTRTVLSQTPALLIHDETGFTARSLVCTHLGCTLEASDEHFACRCHGSRFDATGTVMRGPAVKALPELHVETRADGHLIVSLTERG